MLVERKLKVSYSKPHKFFISDSDTDSDEEEQIKKQNKQSREITQLQVFYKFWKFYFYIVGWVAWSWSPLEAELEYHGAYYLIHQ